MEPNDPHDPEFKAEIRQMVERYLQALTRQDLLQARVLFLPEFTYKTVNGEVLSAPAAFQALQEDWGPPAANQSGKAPKYSLEGLYVTQGQAFAEITLSHHPQPKFRVDEMDAHSPTAVIQRLVFHQDGRTWKLHSIEEMGQGLFSTDPGSSRPI